MNTRSTLMAFAALGVLAAAVQAQNPPATAPVRLELRLTAGQTHRYRVTTDSTLTANLPDGEQKRTRTRTAGTFDITVEGVDPDGTYTVRVRPVSQSLSVDGNDVPLSDTADDDVTARVTRDGRYSGVDTPPRSGDGPPTGMGAAEFLDTIFDKDVGMPTRPLAVGASWKDRIDSPIDETQPKITVNHTLVAVDTLRGRPVARVLHIVAEPMSPAPEEGVTMTGKMEGGGLASVDVGTGLLVDERDTFRFRMDIVAQNPEDSAERVEMSTEASVKVHIEALNPPAA